MKNAIDILLLNSGGIENEVEIMWIQRADQGFITDKLQFLNRKKALVYAKKTGQFRRNPGPTDYDGPELFSEDLW
ncbi:MAG: hypothetical protein LBQ88_03570 [Treponema sp.]|nr:hypothetical protein [Treponema sp.]